MLERTSGVSRTEWLASTRGRMLFLPDGVSVPTDGAALPGPTLVMVVWTRGDYASVRTIVDQTLASWAEAAPQSVLVLTNSQGRAAADGIRAVTLGPNELSALVRADPALRLHVPSVLGTGAADELVAGEAIARSTFDIDAALALSRVFVPTHAYAATVGVLEAHRFIVLTGPPEMGKTAIARMIGLERLTEGWEAHECNRPEQLWERFARDRKQLFIADDAFGSTEYRPDAAERWALDLPRALQAMDESHWLIWTSRPAPLKAALRRIHREHGVERFPRPAEVQVDAADLDVAEKATILFRHAKAAALPPPAIELIQAEGWTIVSHEHFTPERIRRFVGTRLLELAGRVGTHTDIDALVAEEIREPTAAMAASFHALPDEHRTLLVALLDAPPAPVSERDLTAAFRRHSPTGLTRHAHELVDRLSDHFLRVADEHVTWVHPSWRDLVIDELTGDAAARRSFLAESSIDGVLLALSTAGGSTGARALPLLQEDADWDLLSDRLATLVPELEDPDLSRLFAALGEACAEVPPPNDELAAAARYALELAARRWNREHAVVPVGLLASWFDAAAWFAEPPAPPDLVTTWIELTPTERIDVHSRIELARLDDWTALIELLQGRAAQELQRYGFPEKHEEVIRTFVADVSAEGLTLDERTSGGLQTILRRLSRLAPQAAEGAEGLLQRLYLIRDEPELPAEYPPRAIPDDLRRLLDTPSAAHSDEALVARVLEDL